MFLCVGRYENPFYHRSLSVYVGNGIQDCRRSILGSSRFGDRHIRVHFAQCVDHAPNFVSAFATTKDGARARANYHPIHSGLNFGKFNCSWSVMAPHNSRVVDRCDTWRIHVYSYDVGAKGPDLANYGSSKKQILTQSGADSARPRVPSREMGKRPDFPGNSAENRRLERFSPPDWSSITINTRSNST